MKKRLLILFLLILLLYPFVKLSASDDRSIEVLEKELKSSKGQERFYFLYELSELYYNISFDKCLNYANQALNIALQLDNRLLVAKSYENLGFINVKGQEWGEAINYYSKAKDLYIIINNSKLISAITIKIADLYQKVPDYEKAQYVLENGLLYCKDSVDIAKQKMHMGYCYYMRNKYDTALILFNQAIQFYSTHRFFYKKIEGTEYVGMLYNDWGKYPEALTCYNNVMQLYVDFKDIIGIIKTNYQIALVYYNSGKIDSSLIYIKKVIEVKDINNIQDVFVHAYLIAGKIYLQQKLTQQAINAFNKSISLALEITDSKDIAENYENLSRLYLQLKDYKKALEYYTQSNEIKENNKSELYWLSTLNTHDAIIKNEHQIALLNKETELQNLQLSKQKNMLYFFIFGSLLLVIIISLVYRQSVQRKRTNVILEQQKEEIMNINEELKQQSEEILSQKEMLQAAYQTIEIKSKMLEQTNLELMDNIRYAKRIQGSILPQENYLLKLLPEHFIYFRPRDILSGDFYWLQEFPVMKSSGEDESSILFAAVDCTGHGVSGALLSIVGYNLLNQALFEHNLNIPSEILEFMHHEVHYIWEHSQLQTDIPVHDGMDMALINIDKKSKMLQFAGAKNPLFLIRNKEISIYKATKQAIGEQTLAKVIHYENQQIQLKSGDTIYMFSDGYADQFGGESSKKFKDIRFWQLLIDISDKPMVQQKQIVHETFENWKGQNDQIDDVMVIGIKI